LEDDMNFVCVFKEKLQETSLVYFIAYVFTVQIFHIFITIVLLHYSNKLIKLCLFAKNFIPIFK